MTFRRAVATAVILASTALVSVHPAQAANLRNASEPAEFPPASYKGKQYVDSRGCVYIRAGIDGNVNWVPRVTRGRQHICNANPTFAQAPKPQVPEIADPAPVVAAVPATSPATTQVRRNAPAPKPEVVAAPVPPAAAAEVSVPARQPRFTLASIFAPRQKQVQVVAPAATASVAPVAAAPAPRQVAVAAPQVAACPGLSAISQQYIGTGPGVRCGPQAESPVTYAGQQAARIDYVGVAAASAAQQGAPITPRSRFDYSRTAPVTSSNQRVVPRHVWEQQQQAQLAQPVPQGYRPIWQDGRLNTQRAHGTLAGKASMDLVWTETVPRRLVRRSTGQDVTRANPNLRYPYTDLATQQRDLAYREIGQAQVQAPAQASKPRVTLSSKSRAPEKVAPKPQANRGTYVQVALFAQPGNAQRTAGRLAAKGLPMRIWRAKRGGKAVQLVVAGPFANLHQAKAALTAVKRAGFSDAYLR